MSNPGADNLRAFYSFEADGSDDHTNSYDLTENNTPTYTSGKVGNAADLESGSSEYFSRTGTEFQIADNARTFVAWVNPESLSGSQVILGRWGASGTYEYLLYSATGGDLTFAVSANGTSVAASVEETNLGTMSTSTWYMVAAHHDPTNNLIGVSGNGGSFVTAAHSGGLATDTTPFYVGRQDDGQYWDGLVDQLGVWDEVLSNDNLTWLYNSGNGRTYMDLLSLTPSATADAHALGLTPLFQSFDTRIKLRARPRDTNLTASARNQ